MFDRTRLLGWFKGKSLEKATLGLDLLEASLANGSWVPKASVKVRAAFGGGSLRAKHLGKKLRLEVAPRLPPTPKWGTPEYEASRQVSSALDSLVYALRNCSISFADRHDLSILDSLPLSDSAKATLDAAREWTTGWAPVLDAIEQLDATRPKPVFTPIGASPTVTRTLEQLGIVSSIETLRMCPIKWEKEEYVDKQGKTAYKWVAYLDPPVGTKRNSSRHASGNHCHACGHAIRNPYNWVPLLVDDASGQIHLIMVGRDCSETLFGVKVTGEVDLGAAVPGAETK